MFEALLAAARELYRHGPVPLLFADAAADYLIDNWLAHARRAGVPGALLVALDTTVAARPPVPGCALVHVPFAGDFAELWLLRLRVFSLLAAAGIDLVHSDLDAVWLADARAECFADASLDLVFSQGTFHPPAAQALWGFVLCCGLFAARAGPAAERFLAAVAARAAVDRDDQAAVNLVLAESDFSWSPDPAARYELRIGSRALVCHRTLLRGAGAGLGVRIGLLPYHRVPRLVTASPGALVKHPFSKREPAVRIAALRRSGVWDSPQPSPAGAGSAPS